MNEYELIKIKRMAEEGDPDAKEVLKKISEAKNLEIGKTVAKTTGGLLFQLLKFIWNISNPLGK